MAEFSFRRKAPYAVSLVLSAAIFGTDLLTPLGVVVWVLYVGPLFSVPRSAKPSFFWFLCGLLSLMITTGFFFSPSGVSPFVGTVNRLMGIFIVWVVGVLLVGRAEYEARLQKINDELREKSGHLAARTEELTAKTRDLEERTLELQAVNRELEAFTYSVSHDLRAPLRAVDGFSRMVLEENGEKFDPESRRRLEVVRANAQKMGQLIDDLLQFSRLSRAEMRHSRFDMARLVREVLREMTGAEPGQSPAVEIGDLPEAHGDPNLVRQLVANLLSNALKFTRGKEGARVEIGSFEESGEPVYYIKDNGVGFDMKYSGKLFGVFQRLVSEREFEGTGVGLAIVHRIVQRHGGRVWAEGKVKEGAAFYFTLPRRSGDER